MLGSTGSIGRQTLEIVRSLPDRFKVVGLAGGSNIALANKESLVTAGQIIMDEAKVFDRVDGSGGLGIASLRNAFQP